MGSILADSTYRVIQDGIKKDIDLAYNNGRLRAALILIYAGIDSIAYLDLPKGKSEVKGTDFVKWSNQYIRFQCRDQITGQELYGARCGFLHTSRIESKSNIAGKCRLIAAVHDLTPEVHPVQKNVHPNLVLMSILGLKSAFYRGIDTFLLASQLNPDKRAIVEARIETMVQQYRFAIPTN